MNQTLLQEIATSHLGLSALHHVVAVVLIVIWWQRQRETGRALSGYLAFSFLTVAWAARGPAWVLSGAPAVALAALWVRETVRPECETVIARTPRPRLWLALVGVVLAFAWPGYSGELPTFIFAPLGALAAPTVLFGLALIAAVDASRARVLAGAHALFGIIYGVTEIATAGDSFVRAAVAAAVLVALSVSAALAAAGRLPMLEERELPQETSVEQIRTRLYQRKTLLPGPRDPRRRGGRFGRR